MHALRVLQVTRNACISPDLLIFFCRNNNSVEVTRSRGNLVKKSCEFAPMAAQTRPMCCLRCIRQF